MQWLIDIVTERVIAEIGIPPVFIDRGDPVGADFAWANHLFLPAITDLDLSAIIPENATAVALNVVVQNSAISRVLYIRTKGNANVSNIAKVVTQVANIDMGTDMIVAPNADRICEMWSGGIWINVEVTVKGWWL